MELINEIKSCLVFSCALWLLSAQVTYAQVQSGQTASTPEQVSKADKAKELEQLRQEVKSRMANFHPRRSDPGQSKAMEAYANAWIGRVQAVGNRKYLAMAAGDRQYGSVLITAVVKRDGTLSSASVVRSSGFQTLDDAALKAVYEASPFDPFPSQVQDIDELYITRSFDFEHGHGG